MTDPTLQYHIEEKIRQDQLKKKMTGFDADDSSFPSLSGEGESTSSTHDSSVYSSKNHSHFLTSKDHFEDEAINEINKVFPILPKKIIRFAYF